MYQAFMLLQDNASQYFKSENTIYVQDFYISAEVTTASQQSI